MLVEEDVTPMLRAGSLTGDGKTRNRKDGCELWNTTRKGSLESWTARSGYTRILWCSLRNNHSCADGETLSDLQAWVDSAAQDGRQKCQQQWPHSNWFFWGWPFMGFQPMEIQDNLSICSSCQERGERVVSMAGFYVLQCPGLSVFCSPSISLWPWHAAKQLLSNFSSKTASWHKLLLCTREISLFPLSCILSEETS